MPDETNEATDEAVGYINITVGKNLKYDSNMSYPETVFWMEAVRDMVVQRVMNPEE